MNKNKESTLIAIEGTDGSGKTSQFEILKNKLKKQGFNFRTLDFPQYDRNSSYFIKRYLNGDYGNLDEVTPRQASLLYALDRFDVKNRMKDWLSQELIVLCNRYVYSNMAHQAAKIDSPSKRDEFLDWIYRLEYEVLGHPEPDLSLFLKVPAEKAQDLGNKKPESRRSYVNGKEQDIHEESLEHLKKAKNVYGTLVKNNSEFKMINCLKGGELISKEEIHKKVWGAVDKFLT
ncbi:MAG: dTMP kinase [Candidatus Magasanikbacteria bacterium]